MATSTYEIDDDGNRVDTDFYGRDGLPAEPADAIKAIRTISAPDGRVLQRLLFVTKDADAANPAQ